MTDWWRRALRCGTCGSSLDGEYPVVWCSKNREHLGLREVPLTAEDHAIIDAAKAAMQARWEETRDART